MSLSPTPQPDSSSDPLIGKNDDPRVLSRLAPQTLLDAPHRVIFRSRPPVLWSYDSLFHSYKITRSSSGGGANESPDPETPETAVDLSTLKLDGLSVRMVRSVRRQVRIRKSGSESETETGDGDMNRLIRTLQGKSRGGVELGEESPEASPHEQEGETEEELTEEFLSVTETPTTLRELIQGEFGAKSGDDFVIRDRRPYTDSPGIPQIEAQEEFIRLQTQERERMRRMEEIVKWKRYPLKYQPPEPEVEDEGESGVSSNGEGKGRKEESPVDDTAENRHAGGILSRIVACILSRMKIEKLKRQRYIRERVYRELLETEIRFITKMKFFREKYEGPLEQGGFAAFARMIFSNFVPMVEFAERLVQILIKTMYVLPADDIKQEDECPYGAFLHGNLLGEQLLQLIDELTGVYVVFTHQQDACVNYGNEQSASDPKFARLMETIRIDANRVSLLGYLIEPFQRITRYPILLKEMIKRTDPEIPDFPNLKLAQQRFTDAAAAVNAAVATDRLYLEKMESFLLHTPPGYCLYSSANGREFRGIVGCGSFEGDLFEEDLEFDRAPGLSLFEGLPVGDSSTRLSPVAIHVFSTCLLVSRVIFLPQKSVGPEGFRVRFHYLAELDLRNTVLDIPEDKRLRSSFSLHELRQDLRVTLSCRDAVDQAKALNLLLSYFPEAGVHHLGETALSRKKTLSPEEFAMECPVTLTKLQCVRFLQQYQIPVVHLVSRKVTPIRYCSIDRTGKKLLHDDGGVEIGGVGEGGFWSLVGLRGFGPGNPDTLDRNCAEIMGVTMSLLLENQTINLVCLSRRDLQILESALMYIVENILDPLVAGSPSVVAVHAPRRNTLYVWGDNSFNAFGDVAETPAPSYASPRAVKRFLTLNVSSVALGSNSTYPLVDTLSERRVFAFGNGACGKLGHGSDDPQPPLLVRKLRESDIVSVACGTLHSLFLEQTGTVWSCGAGEYGQLGVGRTKAVQDVPVQIPFFSHSRASFVAAGGDHSIIVSRLGYLYAFGKNSDGQLGVGDSSSRSEPTLVEFEGSFTAAAAGLWHTLALTENGQLYAWGKGSEGQLGDSCSEKGHKRIVPYRVPLLERIEQIDCGDQHSVAVTLSGTIYVWGDSSLGQAGLGTEGSQIISQPVELSLDGLFGKSPSRCLQLACGSHHTLALVSVDHRHSVVSWGCGSSGRLGLGSNDDQPTPQVVSFFKDKVVVELAAGAFGSAAIVRHAPIPYEEYGLCMKCAIDLTPGFLARKECHCCFCGGIFCKARTCVIRVKYPIVKGTPLGNGRVCLDCHKILERHFQERSAD